MIRVLCGVLIAVLALAPPAFGGEEPAPAADSAADHVPGRLVVHVVPGQVLPIRLLADLGVTRRSWTRLPGVSTIDLPEHAVERVRARLARDPRVARIEREGVVRAFETEPNDALWFQQRGPQLIGAPDAWSRTTGKEEVVIAVLDTGLDPTHVEFAGRIVPGWSTLTKSSLALDDNGHGTQTAGVLAAEGDNGVGMAGMCWQCSIMPVKVLDSAGIGNTTLLAEGIRWAVDNGADIINMSLGAQDRNDTLDREVAAAAAAGVVLIAAAGNFETDRPVWPAADEAVIGVAASTLTDERERYSSYGGWADVAAPGCNVATTPLNGYTLGDAYCGTSSAAPLVAGTAGLILSRSPSATPDDVRAAITGTAVSVGDWVAFGRIDAGAAVESTAGPGPAPSPSPLPRPPVVPAEPEPEEACPEGRVPDSGFSDIRGNTHELPINCIVWYGVAQGVSETRYGPALSVTRAQMASFIARALERAGVALSASGDHFDDIASSPHRDNINKLANANVVQGTGPRTYSPNAPVRRDQMASFLVRAYELASGEQLRATRSHFDDTRGNVHEANIDKAAEAELVRGTATRTYSPAREVRRDQMGSFIARALERLVARGRMQPN